MKNKRKLFLPLVLVLIIIGISYVTYYGGIEKRKKIITSGAISMMYVESSNIISINKAIPTIDKTGKLEGRGAYICDNKDCLEKIIKNKRLERVFDMQISNEIYESLRGVMIEQ